MAALASNAVTVERGWVAVASPYQITYKQLTLVLTGQGDATDSIDASTLGLGKILGCTPAQLSDNSAIRIASPSYDGSKLFIYANAHPPVPATVSGTFRLTVWGN